jgi:molybdenum cofactor cytidylyltransferase
MDEVRKTHRKARLVTSSLAPDRVAAVILAAGGSSRMGRDKALLPLAGGTFLSACIQRLQSFAKTVIVVAGSNADTLRPVAEAEGAELALNPEPQRGQFSSLRTGLDAVVDRGLDAAIVTHVDRPPAADVTIRNLLAVLAEQSSLPATERKWAVVPQVEGTHGHPIIVGREMIDAFRRASVDLTARDVEHRHQDRIAYVNVTDRNVITNINTPEDYAALRERENH